MLQYMYFSMKFKKMLEKLVSSPHLVGSAICVQCKSAHIAKSLLACVSKKAERHQC